MWFVGYKNKQKNPILTWTKDPDAAAVDDFSAF